MVKEIINFPVENCLNFKLTEVEILFLPDKNVSYSRNISFPSSGMSGSDVLFPITCNIIIFSSVICRVDMIMD